MDDTNPTKEDVEYVDAIQEDIHWLGYDWGGPLLLRLATTSSRCIEYAVELIKKGLAYVCELTAEEMQRQPGRCEHPAPSAPTGTGPSRSPSTCFARMRARASSPTVP